VTVHATAQRALPAARPQWAHRAATLASTALRDLEKIPPRYAGAILEFIYAVLPENPPRVGNPLERELEGLHGARRETTASSTRSARRTRPCSSSASTTEPTSIARGEGPQRHPTDCLSRGHG